MTTKRNLFVRLVPCRCLRGEEETVTSLDYSHCSLEQVPKEIFTFEKTLEELYLDANQIEELPKVPLLLYRFHIFHDTDDKQPAPLGLFQLCFIGISSRRCSSFLGRILCQPFT